MDELEFMNQPIQQYQQTIASYLGKLLRDHFGKGPESVVVSIGDSYIVMYFRNFLTPSERVLLEQDQIIIIDHIREKLMLTLIPELYGYIEVITGIRVREFYYDWNFHNKSGMLVGVSKEPFPGAAAVDPMYPGKQGVEEEISSISYQAQKLPEAMYSLQVAPRLVVAVRDGILVRIEKELIRLGHGEMLKQVKRQLEKSYLHNNNMFEAALGKQVIDVFVDWNLDLDRSVILLVTSSAPKRFGPP